MYKDNIINKKALNINYISTIIETLHLNSPSEKEHSLTVSRLCEN